MALHIVHAFSLIEHNPTGPRTLPEWLPDTYGHAFQLAIPAPGNCNTYKSRLNADGSTTVIHTFACASAKDGSILSGEIAFTFVRGTDNYRVEYRSFKMVVGSTSWIINGTKHIQLHRSAHTATISTPTPLTVAILDSTNPSLSQSFSYGCKLLSDYRVTGTYRLWGWFSFQTGAEPILKGVIAPGESIRWDCTPPHYTHPNFGKVKLTQGVNQTEVVFVQEGAFALILNGTQGRLHHLPACYK